LELDQALDKQRETTTQLEESNKELENFSYSVSHDLQTPLRSIVGYSNILVEDFQDKLGEEGEKALRAIQQNAIRMNNLIINLLEFSRLGRKELQKSEIDTDAFVRNIIDDLSNSIRHKAEIRLTSLPKVWADKNLLALAW